MIRLYTISSHRRNQLMNLTTSCIWQRGWHHPIISELSGAALQMQREVQCFKEVEKLVHPFLKEMPNSDEKITQVIFTEQHKDLLENAEQWMKNTSNSCMVITALIATVMFAAIFTIPGGVDQDDGIPIFFNDKLFMVFAISDALGLILSSTSLFIFLSIQTARYAEEDFLESLPKRLITGLASLFLAIANMVIAFFCNLCSFISRDIRVGCNCSSLRGFSPGDYICMSTTTIVCPNVSLYLWIWHLLTRIVWLCNLNSLLLIIYSFMMLSFTFLFMIVLKHGD